jgi:hypothetical protein
MKPPIRWIVPLLRMLVVIGMLAACTPENATLSPLGSSTPTSTSTPILTPTSTSTLAPAPTSTPAPLVAGQGISTIRARADTWLQVFGARDNMAGTSVVSLGDSSYAVGVGFSPGLPDDFGLLRFEANGQQVQSERYTSEREHTGSMVSQFPSDTLWVKAISLESGKLSLAFDTVWLPEVGMENTLSGWQVSLGDNPAGLVLTDLVKVDDFFFLRAAVGDIQNAHLAILKVNSSGAVDTAVEYPAVCVPQNSMANVYPTAQAPQGGKMFLTDDGYLLTSGFLRLATLHEQAVVLWLNQDGSLHKSVTVEMQPYQLYPDALGSRSYGYQDLALLPGGDIILVQKFQVCSLQCDSGGALITRLSPSGRHIWTVGFHALQIGGETFVNEIRQEGDTLILVGGSTAFEGPENDYTHINMMMASLEASSGRPVWVRSLGPVDTSGLEHEYKTDIANAFLPVGDGRMIVTGTSDSFGSRQIYNGPPPYGQHLDLVLGMVGLENGGILGASNLMWSPDLTDKYQVWAEEKFVTLAECSVCDMQDITEGVSLGAVTYTAEGLELEQRDLDSGFPPWLQGLQFSIQDHGRGLISSSTFFATDSLHDIDGDGLDQDWENAALDLVRPLIYLHNDETWLKSGHDDQHVIHLVRVSPYPSKENPVYIIFEYAVTWSMDYGALIASGTYLNDPIIFENHRGDVEFVKMAWRIQNERSIKLEWVYTAAHDPVNTHKGVWNAYDPTCNRAQMADTGYLTLADTEAVGTELMCAALAFKNNHVLLYAALDKHAMYPSLDVCNKHTHLVVWSGGPVWSDSCGSRGPFLFDAYNIGEPDGHLISELWQPWTSGDWIDLTESQVQSLMGLFPNETVWNGNLGINDKGPVFCGGLSSPPYTEACARTVIGNALSLDYDHLGILVPMLGPTTYRVRIQTSGDLFSGTDAGVYITLFTADGNQYRQELDGSFEKGSLDIFHVGDVATYTRALEGRELVKIGLEMDFNDPNPDLYVDLAGFWDLSRLDPTTDWKVNSVEVLDKVTGHKWTFTINQVMNDDSLHIFQPDISE